MKRNTLCISNLLGQRVPRGYLCRWGDASFGGYGAADGNAAHGKAHCTKDARLATLLMTMI